MLRQAEKRQHRGACALRCSKTVWWVSGLSVIGNVNVVQLCKAVASEANGAPWSSEEHR